MEKAIRIYRTIDEARALSFPMISTGEATAIQWELSHIVNDQSSTSAKVAKLLTLTDRIVKIPKEFSVCSQKCSHCCHIPVSISGVEADLLAETSGREIKKRGGLFLNKYSPCPFLRKNECSVYDVRPLVCRAHFAFDDPQYCKAQTVPHATYTVASNGFLGKVMKAIDYLNQDKRAGDIRAFFK
ncbi:YkgJ family cysteine cluster protein [Novimethylophilus kurashikiensis]|uniref:YkgJ family cysteine cluster protein n=1 Tax=Novimethylophilus kurashikiensis TaxID=1825523 RepID=UPI000D5928B8|nr:YkgJ family cysteine cluster protein [Novimethylophilus kurashikiensis]